MLRCSTAGLALTVSLALAACSEPTANEADRELEVAFSHVPARSLLECPAREALLATGVIGPEGGRLAVGDHALFLPPGAVSRSTTFTMIVPASRVLEVEIHADGQESFQFRRPAMITIGYDRCPDEEVPGRITAWYIDSESRALLEEMAGIDHRDTRAVSFLTTHLSGFALAN